MKRKEIPLADLQRVQEKAIDDYFWKNYENDDCHLCSLCGNSGIIDTRGTAISGAGINAGRLNYCICPNGRVMRKENISLEASVNLHRKHASLMEELDRIAAVPKVRNA